jgi:hypothetical protein
MRGTGNSEDNNENKSGESNASNRTYELQHTSSCNP